MKAIPTPDTNLTLTLEGAHDLPAEQCRFEDPDGTQTDGYETTWQPDPGEQAALANGAPILLRLWGHGHPPVNVAVGEPPPHNAQRMLPASLVDQALSMLWAELTQTTQEDVDPDLSLALHDCTPRQFADLWAGALEQAHRTYWQRSRNGAA